MLARPKSVVRTLVALTILAFGVAVASPTVASADTAPQTWNVLVGSESPDMAISGMRFLPGEITIDAGDTVNWVANSAEPHTVTFLPGGQSVDALPPLDPMDPQQVMPQGGSVYNPADYFNSGILTNYTGSGFPLPVPVHTDYQLTFPSAGTFTYYCLVHGVMMMGTITVQPAGTPYPHTQAYYDHEAQLQANAIRVDGNRLRAEANRAASQDTVLAGADDGTAMLMRFVRSTASVHVGDTVTFHNGSGAPHTVTFGNEPANPFDPSTIMPAATYGGGDLSVFLPPGFTTHITFTAPGTYHYICAVHDFMGMVGTVVVTP
ncbi:MAG TPA: plastocyanin/azurin family copper-binding protein [Marmoricola sp.]|nr:plastocyanin/azurin family copper-binding protein [Marmoricola sp.]